MTILKHFDGAGWVGKPVGDFIVMAEKDKASYVGIFNSTNFGLGETLCFYICNNPAELSIITFLTDNDLIVKKVLVERTNQIMKNVYDLESLFNKLKKLEYNGWFAEL
jgi:hypothetical protein